MTAFFLINPSLGHLFRSFSYARELANVGFKIVYSYSGDEELLSVIKQQGFDGFLITSIPFGCGIEEYNYKKNKVPYLEVLLDKITNRSFYERTVELLHAVAIIKPNKIVIDAFLSTDFIILYPIVDPKVTKILILQNMLSTYYDEGFPPLNSILSPEKHSKFHIKFEWKRQMYKKWYIDFVQKMKYFGLSRINRIIFSFKKNNIPKHNKILNDKLFHVGFDNVPELIAVPEKFEFSNKIIRPFQKYLNTYVDTHRVEVVQNEYMNLMSIIQHEKNINSNIKTIFVSLGTVQEAKNSVTYLRFFEKLLNIAQNTIEWKFILVVRPDYINTFTTKLPNVYVYSRVSQFYTLQNADVFITHGGLNSVLESIYNQVPMLALPLNRKWDLPGYASRIEYHGIGLMANIDDESYDMLRTKIKKLLLDDTFKTNLKRLHKDLQA